MALGDRRGARKFNPITLAPFRCMLCCVIILFFVSQRVLFKANNSLALPADRPNEAVKSDGSLIWQQKVSSETAGMSSIQRNSNTNSLRIDILSIGSKSRSSLQDAQQSTFGRHPSVRSFVRATEDDDFEADCHAKLAKRDAFAIAKYCRGLNDRLTPDDDDDDDGPYAPLQKMTVHFATRKWLGKKKNPAGWMCAQKRPADAFFKLLQTYSGKDGTTTMLLPDFLAIVDDDTYLNMPAVVQQLEVDYPTNTDPQNKQAYAVSGCMIRSRLYEHNFTHPFGGFGMFLNRQALENFMLPLNCSAKRGLATELDHIHGDFSDLACWRLKQNSIGEQPLFHDGMSIADLMRAYVSNQPYLQHRKWENVGYCLHSDWMWGYFSNYYPVSSHTADASFSDVPQDRMRAYRGSTIYAGRQTREVIAARRECDNKGDVCTTKSHLCHYVTPEQMQKLQRDESKLPP